MDKDKIFLILGFVLILISGIYASLTRYSANGVLNSHDIVRHVHTPLDSFSD